jgi:single-strand DNA-binding protein
MAGFNRIIMIGNLTRDPDYKQLNSGQGVCKLGIASNRQFKNRQTGGMSQEVCYIDVDVWGPQAETCKQYLQKGRPVLVEGRLRYDSWEDQQGQMRSKHTIVADRVIFLASGAQNDISDEKDESDMPEPTNQAEKELFDQIATIKKRTTGAIRAPQPATARRKKVDDMINTGEINIPDEPPFQEDLPF